MTSNAGFQIVSGNEDQYFNMTDTGLLIMSQAIDRETTNAASLTISAKAFRGNGPPSSQNLTLNFEILDENDNAPTVSFEGTPIRKFYYNVTYDNVPVSGFLFYFNC